MKIIEFVSDGFNFFLYVLLTIRIMCVSTPKVSPFQS